jgi:transcriptional regulator with XRE-family HTH domain
MRKGNAYTYTLGGARLAALRRQAGKTQLVVEADAGLGSGYVQRIESGKVRQPERATLERILDALETRYSERREVLALFGYLVATPLPSEAEIAWAREVSREELQAVPFPAYLLDCGVRLLAWNRLVPAIFPVVAYEGQPIAAEHWSMFLLWFDPRYGVTELVRNHETLFAQLVRAFRHELQLVAEEPWCAVLVESLLRDLPLFRAAWERPDPTPTASAARALVPLQLRLPNVGTLQFRISAEPFTRDARFRVVYLLPADPTTMRQCARWGAEGEPRRTRHASQD